MLIFITHNKNKIYGLPFGLVGPFFLYVNPDCQQNVWKINKNQFKKLALAVVAQWIERQPVNQRVTGSIPSQDTCLGCGQVPSWGHMRGNHTWMFPSLSFSFPYTL